MENKVLAVRTLGEFSMTWDGRPVGAGPKTRNSQFTRLVQLLIHRQEKGASRAELEALVFEESNSEDLQHMMRSLLYNTRKKFRSAGLPDSEYIIYEGDTFYWDENIPVCEDTVRFEELIRKAGEGSDPERKAQLYKEAIFIYGGEFLPSQRNLEWVIPESRRYRDLFTDCVYNAAELMRNTDDFGSLEEIGIHASRVDPLAGWEFLIMEALVSMERFEEARTLYQETEDRYMNVLGVKPSADMADLMEKLGYRMGFRFALIDEIKSGLTGSGAETDDLKICTYPVFRGIYRFIESSLDRSGQSVYLMLCTITDSGGNAMKDGAVLDRLSDKLAETIVHSVRRSDVVCRYGKGQYLILLLNTTSENCALIEQRITKSFCTEGQRASVRFNISAVSSV